MTLYEDVLAVLPAGTEVLDPAKRETRPPFVVILMAGGELFEGRLMDTVQVYCAGSYETEHDAEIKLARFVGGIVRALNAAPNMIVESWTEAEGESINDAERTISFLVSTITVRAPL